MASAGTITLEGISSAQLTADHFNIVASSATDLTLSNLTVNASSLATGDDISGSVVVTNNGTAATGSDFTVKVYLSSDGSETGAIYLATVTVGALAAGASYTVNYSDSIPTGQYPDGPYHVSVTADTDHSVVESYENNNTLTSSEITIDFSATGGNQTLETSSGDSLASNSTTTGTIEIDTIVTAFINGNPYRDVDWIAVNLIAGETYHFAAQGQNVNPLGLSLYQNSSTLLAGDNAAYYGVSSTDFSYVATSTGTYYLQVDGGTDSQFDTSSEYTLSASLITTDGVLEVSGQDSLASNPTTSGSVEIGNNVTAFLHNERDGDSDWIAFDLTAGHSYQFSVAGNVASEFYGLHLYIHNTLGQLLESGISNLSTYDMMTFDATTTGTFYINVSGSVNYSSSGEYILSTSEVTSTKDLTLSDITLTSSGTTFNAGDPITGSVIVHNNGSALKSGFEVGIYLSVDSSTTADDILLQVLNVNALSASDQTNVDFTFNLPNPFDAGTYTVVARADIANTITEEDETNNDISSTTFTIGGGTTETPDLVATNFVINNPVSSYQDGDTITGSVTVTNNGTGSTGSDFQGDFVLSSDSDLTGNNNSIDFASNIGALDAGTSRVIPFSFTLAAEDLADGTYYLSFNADINGAVTESNETNNISSPIAIEVVGGTSAQADLVITDLTLDQASAGNGDTITGSVTFQNVGDFSTEQGFTANLQFSGSNGNTDSLSHAISVATLAVNSSATITFSIPFTSDLLAEGNYSVIVTADNGNDTIVDFSAGDALEQIDISAVTAFTDFADLLVNHASQNGSHVLITDGANTIKINNVNIDDLIADDFIF